MGFGYIDGFGNLGATPGQIAMAMTWQKLIAQNLAKGIWTQQQAAAYTAKHVTPYLQKTTTATVTTTTAKKKPSLLSKIGGAITGAVKGAVGLVTGAAKVAQKVGKTAEAFVPQPEAAAPPSAPAINPLTILIPAGILGAIFLPKLLKGRRR